MELVLDLGSRRRAAGGRRGDTVTAPPQRSQCHRAGFGVTGGARRGRTRRLLRLKPDR
jgi:hypothetical protein